jgi:hypothetical protein
VISGWAAKGYQLAKEIFGGRSMHIHGGCHCGNISYEADIDPEKVIMCHCTDCQTLSGTAFRTVVFVPESQFNLLKGSLKTYVKTADSGNKRAQTFCPECGTHIYATSVGGDERVLGLRVGTAGQRGVLRPKKQYWCRSALDWVTDLSAIDSVE